MGSDIVVDKAEKCDGPEARGQNTMEVLGLVLRGPLWWELEKQGVQDSMPLRPDMRNLDRAQRSVVRGGDFSSLCLRIFELELFSQHTGPLIRTYLKIWESAAKK